MMGRDFPNWPATIFLVTNAVAYGVLCAITYYSGLFHLRLLCEALAVSYLVLLTIGAWLTEFHTPTRLLLALLAVVFVALACRCVLVDGFTPWFEVALWYVPLTSVLCGGLRVMGCRIEISAASATTKLTFSIRLMLLATTTIALLISIVTWLARSRTNGQLDSLMWFSDPLTQVTPITLVCTGIACGVLSNRPLHAAVLLLSAPVLGLVIGRIYNWSDFRVIVLSTTAAATLATALSYVLRSFGFQLVRHKRAT